MKLVKNIFDQLRPFFAKEGKLHLMYPLFEAIEAFFLSSDDVTSEGVHLRDRTDLKRMMSLVIIALIPCTLFGIWNTGHQMLVCHNEAGTFFDELYQGATIVLPIIAVSYIVGGLWEIIFAVVRRHEINEGFLVTGLLFPLILPPTIPLWQVALGVSFGVVIGKEVFGGSGMNVVNPALAGRAFLFFAYPACMTGNVWVAEPIFPFPDYNLLDAASSATPLSGSTFHSVADMFTGVIPGSIGETCVPAILLGAFFLILTKVGSWRIMLSCVTGFIVTAIATSLLGLPPDANPRSLLFQLAAGGFIFGTVFMATDPVSAPAAQIGHWIYGFLIGGMTVLIRVANPAYPEGMMLAILFMNFISPLIDYVLMQLHIKWRRQYA